MRGIMTETPSIDTVLEQPRRRDEQGLDAHINAAAKALLAQQREDGHWIFELEADAPIPAEYVLLSHYLGEPVDPEREATIAAYLRRVQRAHGGWPLFHDGAFN